MIIDGVRSVYIYGFDKAGRQLTALTIMILIAIDSAATRLAWPSRQPTTIKIDLQNLTPRNTRTIQMGLLVMGLKDDDSVTSFVS